MDKKIKKKKWPLKRVIQWSLIGVFVLAVIYGLLFKTGGSILNVEQERLTISTVEQGPFQEFIPILGTVRPHKIHYLSAMLGGRVEKIFIRAGSKVKKGDIILKLSNTNLLMTMLNNEAQINRASNDLRATRLQLERNRLDLRRQTTEVEYALKKTKKQYERYEVLYKEDLISKKEYEDSKDEFEYLEKKKEITLESQQQDLKFSEEQVRHLDASVNQMQKNLGLLKQQLENLTVRAPVTGQLTSLEAEVGESKTQGVRFGQVDEEEGFLVRAEIDEHYINRIETGRKGNFPFDNKTYELSVKIVYPEVKDGKFEVDLIFSGQEAQGIKRGQTLHIKLQLSEMSEAILLARGGFYQTTGGNWVFVVDAAGGFAVKRTIRLGRQNPEFFEVLEGLQPGEKVITSSYENYGDIERLEF
ncbi:MAG: HlyD family efflux transporter periplasmic adaptor subunit [Candidatus Aminicenantes bacterium]|nr:HlyD family efflux transporter periplasmic adaptor subunit [Candidatus Aminicenantes bacterium]